MARESPRKLVKRLFRRMMGSVWTAVPGVIYRVHKKRMKVDVKLKVKWTEDPITIENVRLLYPQSSSSKFLFNVSEGDTVMLFFSKYSLECLANEQIFEVDGQFTINADEEFEMQDAIAFPGITLDKDVGKTVNDSVVEIPDGIKIISSNDILISGDSVEIEGLRWGEEFALNFCGECYVEIEEDASNVFSSNGFSIEMRVYSNDLESNNTHMHIDGENDTFLRLYENDGDFHFSWFDGARIQVETITDVNPHTWYVRKIVYDGTNLIHYLDDEETNNITTTIDEPLGDMYLGSDTDGSYKFIGSISRFQIWDRWGNVKVLYPMNEGSGDILYDQSNNDINASIHGCEWHIIDYELGISSFTTLTDTPETYQDSGGQYVMIKDDESGLTFTSTTTPEVHDIAGDRHSSNTLEELSTKVSDEDLVAKSVVEDHIGNVGVTHHGLVDSDNAGFMSPNEHDKLDTVEWNANDYELEKHNHSGEETGGTSLNPDEVETKLRQILPQYDDLIDAPDEQGSIIYFTAPENELIEGVYRHDGLSYRLLTDKSYVDFAVASLSINYFLTNEDTGVNDPDDGEYKKTSLEPVDIPEQSISVSGSNADDYHIQSWVCPEDYLPTELLAGIYSLTIDAERTDGTRRVRLFYRAYEKKDDETEEFLIESAPSELITDRESIVVSGRLPYHEMDEGSCIVFKLYMRREQQASSDEVTVYYGGDTGANISLPTSTVILDEIYASNPHKIGGEQHASDTLANVSGKIQEDIDSLFTTPAQHDLDMDGKDIDNIDQLDWSGGLAYPRIIESGDEPTLNEGAWCIWIDEYSQDKNTYLVLNVPDNGQKKVELW